MKNLLKAIIFSTLLLAGCKESKTEFSDIKYEDAIVKRIKHRADSITLDPDVYLGYIFHGNIDFIIHDPNITGRFQVGNLAKVSYRCLKIGSMETYVFIDAWKK